MAIDTIETTEAAPEFEMEKPQAEHEWLQKFVGEWRYESGAVSPTGDVFKVTGTMSVRSIGGFFIQGESLGEMPGGGGDCLSFITLGFDPQQGKYVGTWFGSMMTKLWVYDATREGDTLILASEGPSFTTPGATAMYHDIVELVSDDHHTLTAKFQNEDGTWTEMMKTDYYRKS